MSDGDTEPPILRPAVSLRHYDYRSHPVFPPFVDTVATFWTVSWDLAHRYTAQVLPWPSVNLTVTDTEAAVTGLVRRRTSGTSGVGGLRSGRASVREASVRTSVAEWPS